MVGRRFRCPGLGHRASASGPLEESVRLVALFAIARDLDTAYSIGLGWASIEIVYAIVNGAVLASIRTRTDDKPIQARRQLEELGMLRDFPAYMGVVEWISASAFHIGSTLLLAAWPILLIVAIPVHSALNLCFLVLLKRSMLRLRSTSPPLASPRSSLAPGRWTLFDGLPATDRLFHRLNVTTTESTSHAVPNAWRKPALEPARH